MRALRGLRFLRFLVLHNLKASVAQRGAFLLQVAFMAANNLLYCATWWVLFTRFERIRGWALADVLALYGLAATAFGLSVALAGGVRDLSRSIVDGDIDTLLTQPKNVLVQAAASRSLANGWGDVASGVTLLGLGGYLTLGHLPVLVVGIGLSFVVLTASGIILHCSAFWLGRVESLARTLYEFLITFSLYPPSLFGGAVKVLLFTVLPAGFVSHLPVELLRDFDWGDAALATAGAAFYAWLAGFVFARGLSHYESGNRFVVRA